MFGVISHWLTGRLGGEQSFSFGRRSFHKLGRRVPILIAQGGKAIHVSVAEMRSVWEPRIVWFWQARFMLKLGGSGRDEIIAQRRCENGLKRVVEKLV